MGLERVEQRLPIDRPPVCPACHKEVQTINAVNRYDDWFHADCYDAWNGKPHALRFEEVMTDHEGILEKVSLDLTDNHRHPPTSTDFGDLIEKLIVSNIKLYMLKDRQAELVKSRKEYIKLYNEDESFDSLDKQLIGKKIADIDAELAKLAEQDIELCRARGALKKQINAALGGIGHDGVKMYGK